MNKNKLQNIYGYNLDHGDMIIFGDNLKYCIQYNNWNPNSNLVGEWCLLNNTVYSVQSQNTERIVTIPNLSKYKKICVEINAGDALGRKRVILEKIGDGTLYSYHSTTNIGLVDGYYAKTQITVSFNNSTISIKGISKSWDLSTCSFSKVWGIR